MKIFSFIIFFFILFIQTNCSSQPRDFQFGADQLLSDYIHLIKNKKIGIVTNHTAILKNGVHLVDTLNSFRDIKIIALFAPEHGIRGDYSAGESVDNSVDSKTGIHVYSLYGKDKKPTKEMLKDIQVLIFDIQDIGARFYTYISTLFYSIQAAAENNIPIIILDRPNPINGNYVDGPIRKQDLVSFVGIAPIPIAHGMTVGELAMFFVGEKLIADSVEIRIIKMKNWNRNLFFSSFCDQWIHPSPNIPSLETAIVYPGTCLIEGTNISEGRGTNAPFLTIGAPFINSTKLIEELLDKKSDGVLLEPISFTPKEIKGRALNPKYKNESCNGITIKITDSFKFESVKFGIKLISTLYRLYHNDFKFKDDSFDRLSGDKLIRQKIIDGISSQAIIQSYQSELNVFKEIRKKYLLY